MTKEEKKIAGAFKRLLEERINIHDMVVFGSRARGDAAAFSDMDIMVIIDQILTDEIREYISDCAWEAGYRAGMVIVPVVYDRKAYETGPEKYSLVVRAAEFEGIHI